MRLDKIHRRMFLTGLGGSLVAMPFLPSLLPRSLRSLAAGQADGVPRRFVAIKTYNGAPVLDFWPRNAPGGYGTHGVDGTVELTERLSGATGRHGDGNAYFGHYAPLSDFRGTGVSNVFGDTFTPYFDQMNLLRGLDFMPNLNHNHGGFLGNLGLRTNGVGGVLPGAQINVTIDHVLARAEAVYPTTPAGPRILHLGSRSNTCSYGPANPSDLLATGRDAVQQSQAYTNPRTAFDALFAGFEPPDGGGGDDPGISARLVDRVYEDYRRARDSRYLSADDRMALERHMTLLAELEDRLGVGTGGMRDCDPASSRPPAQDTGGEFDVTVSNIEAFFEDMVDLVGLAFDCDVTRVVTLDVQKMVIRDGGDVFGMGDSENAGAAGRSNWHLQAHNWDVNARRWLGLGNQWVAERVVARLLARLSERDEADGESILHHSLVLWGNELSFNHLNYAMPTALFGSAGGRVRTGRYLDFIDHDRPIRFRQHDGSVVEGVQYNRLLVSVLQAMGLEPAEYEVTPGRGFGEARPVEKGGGFALDYDDSNVGQPLPDLLVG